MRKVYLFVKNTKSTVRHIKMAANKMQIIDIFTQHYVAAQQIHKDVSGETAASGISKVQSVSSRNCF